MTERDLTEVAMSALARYPLLSPRPAGSLPASTRNDNLLVQDAAGGTYVLRRYRRNPSSERMEFQLRLQQHLFRHGLPTSRVIETDGGKRFVCSGDGFWALFTFVPGTEYDFQSEGQVRQAATWLARFHVGCEGFRGAEAAGETIPDVRRWWLEGEAELVGLEAMFRDDGVDAELSYLRRWRSRLIRKWPLAALDALPRAWVHGDYHGRNVLFADDRLVGMFDFDVVHRGFRTEDVAMALFTFGRPHRHSRRIRPGTALAFLDEYVSRVGLTKLERRALPMMASLVQARTAARYAVRLRDGEDIVRAFRAHVGRMRSLPSQVASLAGRVPADRGADDHRNPDPSAAPI